MTRPAVLAVDGGNSKTDVALVAEDGSLLAAVRGPTTQHQAIGLETAMDRLSGLVAEVALMAGQSGDGRVAELGSYALAGADSPSDVRLLTRALGKRAFATRDIVVNDTFAGLRAGTDRGWGVVLVCGQGVNAAAVAPNGRTARFAGLGDISGDWGGGMSVGMAGLAAAVRGSDRRGAHTVLEQLVPRHFGVASPASLVTALYRERIARVRMAELSPLVFRAAGEGDAVARQIVDRLADELAAMATALIRRLRLARLDVEVVRAGGVFQNDDAPFRERLDAGVRTVAPQARVVRSELLPVGGATLLGLDRLIAEGTAYPSAVANARLAFATWRPARA